MAGLVTRLAPVCLVALCAGAVVAAPIRIGAESVVPVNPRSEWCRYVNWRPADGEVVDLNPPRISWPYNADFPDDFGDALHMFTLQIADSPDFADPAVDVTCAFNFYNTIPALDPAKTWHWRVGYDVGTGAGKWSDVRSFTIAEDAVVWDRSALAEPDLAERGHPRVLLSPEKLAEIRALAETDPGSRAALERMRGLADRTLERPWWADFPPTDREEQPERDFYRIAEELATVAFVWRVTGDDRYSGVVERAVTWASYPPGGRASPEGLGGDGNEDATQGNEFLALLFDWLYEDMTEDQRRAMIASLEWRIDHVMNSFAWRAGRATGPMLRMTFRSDRQAASFEAEALELSGEARVVEDERASGGRLVQFTGPTAAITLTLDLDRGPYVVQVAAHGPAPDQDAFYVGLDDEKPQRTFVSEWGEASVTIQVEAAGEHTITVTPSEVGVRIDRVRVDVHGDQRLKLGRTTEWTEFAWQVEAPAQGTMLTVEPFNYYARGEVWWDAISLSRTPDGPNLLANGDFSQAEGETPAGWSFSDYGRPSQARYEPTGGRDGTGAVGIVCPASSDRGAWQQRLAINEPGTYYVRGRYRTDASMLTSSVRGTSLSGMISSHQFEASMDTAVCGLVLYEHSAIGREWFELMLNYLLGVTCGYGFDEAWNEGAGYGSSKNKWLTNASLYFDTALPEANLGRNPFYARVGSWLRRIIPVGMGHHAWGNQANASRGNHLAAFRKLAYLTGDGRFLYNWQSYGGELSSTWRPWIEYVLPAYYDAPEPVPEAESAELFDVGGWAMAASGPPSDPATYADGAGVILQCRPRGGYSHSFNSDGSVQLHAYGQMLNHGGGTSANGDAYAYHTMSHNVVLIDGLGQGQPPSGMLYPTYGHICGYRQDDDVVYMAADPTLCYPHEPGSFARWSLPLREPYTERALPYLDSYVRHVLFVRDRYFVIYDDLRCTQPATFTWLWHILPDDPLAFDRETFAIDYTVGEVPVRLQHIFRPDALVLDDRQGLDGRVNPITGEDYRGQLKGEIIEGHNLWVSTREPAAEWRFLAVIYPQPPGGGIPPIERIDDRTVRVGEDVICFDPTSPAAEDATFVVDPAAFRAR